MTVQAVLREVVKHCALGNIETLKVTSDDDGTKVQTFDTDKTLFVEVLLNDVIPEFEGEFGISNLKMLAGLLDFANYQTDNATFKASRRPVNGKEVLDQFEFKGGGSKSIFKLMNIEHVPQQATIANIPWTVTLTELTKAKMAEFQKFAGLYSEIDKLFGASVEDGNLILSFGEETSSTHFGQMVFQEGVVGSLTGNPAFPVDKFLTLMRIALNAESSKLMFTSKGLLGVEVVSNHGIYKYFLRQSVRG